MLCLPEMHKNLLFTFGIVSIVVFKICRYTWTNHTTKKQFFLLLFIAQVLQKYVQKIYNYDIFNRPGEVGKTE